MFHSFRSSSGYLVTRPLAHTIGRTVHARCSWRAFSRPPDTSRSLYPNGRRHFAIPAVAAQRVNSTIYALSTAPGRAAIAVIRVSGPACFEIYRALCPRTKLPAPRYAAVRSLYEPSSDPTSPKSPIDSQALVLYFPAPKSVTGEDILEFHIHGGAAVTKAVLSAIGRCSTVANPVRYAEAGEFTRRAFLNDRMDLPQIESLGDTLSAVTEEQRRLSVEATTSGLADRYETWRKQLLGARGELEALIDFSEDQHFDESPAELISNVAVQIRSLLNLLHYHRANAFRGELLRNGISISLIGAPNVGKSSLLNLIVGRNAAIVSKEAGTTRDIVEVGIDLGGFFCRLGDTAGLRQDDIGDASKVLASVIGDIEKEGIRRAKERALNSDIVLLVLSIEPFINNQGASLYLEPGVLDAARQLLELGKTVVIVVNKMDNYGAARYTSVEDVGRAIQIALPEVESNRIFCISCHEAEDQQISSNATNGPGNLQHFLSGLTKIFKEITAPLRPDITSSEEADPSQWQESLGVTQRQAALLDECATYLNAFLVQTSVSVRSDEDVDIVAAAEALRAAADCIGRITGRGDAGDVEEVLGVVFEK